MYHAEIDCESCCRGICVAKDIARGLAYLHQKAVIHLDIKSAAFSHCLQTCRPARSLYAAYLSMHSTA